MKFSLGANIRYANSPVLIVEGTAFKPKPFLCLYLTADISSPAGTKRSLSEEKDEDDEEIKAERDGKRARLEGEELEAQLELKITANAGSRHKLEKVCYLFSQILITSIACSRLPCTTACFRTN